MLINIVILVLRDMLPLAILFVWLIAYLNPRFVTIKSIVIVLLISVFGIFVFFKFAPNISEYFAGSGLEYFQVMLIVTIYISLLIGSVLSLNNLKESLAIKLCLNSGLCCLLIIQGANFLIYFNGYLSRSSDEIGIFIGVIVAIGIGLSFSILYYFVLRSMVENRYFKLLNSFWALFLAGIFTQLVPLLSQVDVINDAKMLWNSSWLIQDSSEYGHLFKALLGYEATPSLSFIIVYLIGFSMFYIFMWLKSKFVLGLQPQPLVMDDGVTHD